MTPDRLLAGLDAIAATVSTRPQALALLALGSCGVDTRRLDAFSDLDFFVIVEESVKLDFLADLDWLTCGKPLVFAHRNTVDGWKTLDEDGVLCEFAVFHPAELAHIPYSKGRVVWSRDGFDTSILAPTLQVSPIDTVWACSEALTNLLVGLKRYLRGEKQAASRSIKVDAAENICRVMMVGLQSDIYNPWRRMEVINPETAHELNVILQQSHLPEIASDLMVALAKRTTLPQPLCAEIQRHLDLCDAR